MEIILILNPNIGHVLNLQMANHKHAGYYVVHFNMKSLKGQVTQITQNKQ